MAKMVDHVPDGEAQTLIFTRAFACDFFVAVVTEQETALGMFTFHCPASTRHFCNVF